MNIMLVGAGLQNKGAEAMLRTVSQELQRRSGAVRCQVTVDAVEAHSREGLEEFGIRILPAARSLGRTLRLALLRPGLITPIISRDHKWLRFYDGLSSSDAVVDISGYAYGDPWGSGPARVTAMAAEFCAAHCKPYLFFPQAWGPFESAPVRMACARACRAASIVTARDAVSQEYLKQLPGLPPECIVRVPDIAFRFTGASPETGIAVLRQLGLPVGSRPIVGVAPNMKVYVRTPGTAGGNRYVLVLAEICRMLRRAGAAVILLPHHLIQAETGTVDDRMLCSLVEGRVRDPAVIAWTDCPTAPVIKSVIGQLDLLVGSRFHALVAALSSGVPAFALGWSHKYVELLRPFGLQDFVANHDQLDLGVLLRQFESGFQRREQWKQKVAQALPAVEAEVDRFFDRVAELFFERSS